jgi:uncharacterized membrane protein
MLGAIEPTEEHQQMESRAKLAGHAIHPMLIVFPLGLLGSAVVFDILFLVTGRGGLYAASFYNILAGIVSGLVAGVFGLRDWLAIPNGTRAKRIGQWHGVGNVVVLVLFAVSWWLRWSQPTPQPTTVPLVLELVGVALALVTGWLGGELVERLGVGVDEGAHLDAPSSLSGQPSRTT